MSQKILVGFDNSPAAERALDFAITRAKAQGDSIVIAHVLEWSPYSFLTPTEIEERHKRRKNEMARAETAICGAVAARVEQSGVPVTTIIKYGHIAETLVKIVKDENAALIMIGRTGHSGFSSRIFGSVAGSLAQVAPVPVTIVP